MKRTRYNRAIAWVVFCFAVPAPLGAQEHTIAFEVSVAAELEENFPASGRLFVILGTSEEREPREGVGWAGPGAAPFFAEDVAGWAPVLPAKLGEAAIGFPVERLSELPPGQYLAQPLYDVDTVFSYINAPGNYYGTPRRITIAGGGAEQFQLLLDQRLPDEQPPPDETFVKYVRFESRLLSEFWRRPMFLRAAVILPRTWYDDPAQTFPVAYHIGGYHARFTDAARMMRPGSPFRAAWFAEDFPQMIYVQLDGEAPYGDSYQTNSANNGPYGDATVRELMPYLERLFRGVGASSGRFVTGGSTGGWASLALQVFYPDSFNGVWSFCADGVDFHHFQLVDIYEDANAFYNQYGYERPSMRDTDGEPRFSIRREVMMERALGRGNTFATSGGQWGGWNAVYGPRNSRGRPAEIWDPVTGAIDHGVAAQWKKYDLRLLLAENWSKLGPKLQGKIHIWMGDMDNFYLDNAMREMEKFLNSTENPKSDAELTFAADQGHCWQGISQTEVLRRMLAKWKAAR